jgi:hypothetical protein
MQGKLQEIAASVRPRSYLPERMFPRFREQIGTALDLIVEFSTLGEYRLGVSPTPGAACAPADAPDLAPRLGGAGENAERAAVRRNVAGGAIGMVPVATPAARRHAVAPGHSPAGCEGERRHASDAARAEAAARRQPDSLRQPGSPREAASRRRRSASPRRTRKGAPVAPEQLCLAV